VQVRANCERGYRADWIDRKYSPPDWAKVYPVFAGVEHENMAAYSDLINGFTQMLEPNNDMELIFTKEATDATWEAGRISQQKALLAERKHRKRLEAQADCERVLAKKERNAARRITRGLTSQPSWPSLRPETISIVALKSLSRS
jgi:hypothetical protein